MAFVIVPYSIALTITALISLLAALLAWSRRKAPGGIWLALMMFAITEWTGVGALEAAATTLPAKILVSKLNYPGAHAALPLFLLFTLEYTHRRKFITLRNVLLLFAIPLITIFMAATNEWHHLIWTNFLPGPAGTNSVIYQHGAWFYLSTIFIYLLMFFTSFLMVEFALRYKELYRYQSAAIIGAISLPLISFGLYVLNLNPFPGLDAAAISFAGTGTILVVLFLRMQFLQTIPVARDLLIEKMLDGMLVLDRSNHIVDINPAARRLTGLGSTRSIGFEAASLLSGWPELSGLLLSVPEGLQEEETVLLGPSGSAIAVRITAFTDSRGHSGGKLVMLQDITQRKQAESALQQSNQSLQEKLVEIQALEKELREQAIRDALTGLFNRRYLNEILEREFARCAKEHLPLAMVMLDIDHFKNFNDRYGHKAGDEMLHALGALLRAQTRSGDIACRYGGEEFLVIMPGASAEVARRRAEQWRMSFEEFCLEQGDFRIFSTFSGGVGSHPDHGATAAEVLRATDQALYDAKDAGRNCIKVAPGRAVHS